jgi:hypothetical protein
MLNIQICLILKLMIWSKSCLQGFLLNDTTTLIFDLEIQESFSHHGDRVYIVVWPWSLLFNLWLSKTRAFFLSPWWLSVTSCMILNLMVVSILPPRFYTKWHYNIDLWPWKSGIFLSSTKLYDSEAYGSFSILRNATTLTFWPLTMKNNKLHPLIMVIKCTKVYDPEMYGSISILPIRFFYWVMLQPWPLTLKDNWLPLLIKVIKCTKLYNPEA